MTLFRIVLWALVLSATALAGPNVPAQLLCALREITGRMAYRLFGQADAKISEPQR